MSGSHRTYFGRFCQTLLCSVRNACVLIMLACALLGAAPGLAICALVGLGCDESSEVATGEFEIRFASSQRSRLRIPRPRDRHVCDTAAQAVNISRHPACACSQRIATIGCGAGIGLRC
jgi:hypothetical protein